MKRNRIGDVDIDLKAPYWSDNRNDAQLRKSQILYFAKIDCANSEAELTNAEVNKQDYYNQMDLSFCIIRLIDAYGQSEDLLTKAGIVLSHYIADGEFGIYYDSMELRNADLSNKIRNIQKDVENFQDWDFANDEFADEWEHNVMDMNYYCNPLTGERSNNIIADYANVCGPYDYAYYSSEIKKNGEHWLYMSANNLQNDKGEILSAVYKKRMLQIRQASWFESANTNLSKEAIYSLSRSKICERGISPENAIDVLKFSNGSKEKLLAETKKSAVGRIGAVTTGVVGTILAVVSIISGLLSVALSIWAIVDRIKALLDKSNKNAYENAPSAEDLKMATSTIEDWENFLEEQENPVENFMANVVDGTKSLFRSPIAWIVGGGALLLLLTRKR